MRFARVVVLGVTTIAGCIILPTPPVPLGGIPADELAHIEVGATSRVDVLMRFGNPQARLDEDRVFLYRWERLRAVGAVGGPAYALPIWFNDQFVLALKFDAVGRVAQVGHLSAFKHDTLERELEAWLPGMANLLPTIPDARPAEAVPVPARPVVVASRFPSAVWWFARSVARTGTLDLFAQATGRPATEDRVGVRGVVEVRTDRVVFLEPLPSGGEVPYEMRFDEVKTVSALLRGDAMAAIALVRHDGSVESFTLTDDGGRGVNTQRMRDARDLLTKMVQERRR